MLAEHSLFTLIVSVPLIIILWKERADIKTYAFLGIFTVIIASIWEPMGVYMDIWHYISQPQFLGASVLTLVMYFHWICFSYFLGNRAAGRWKK
jgi:FlaA1/EpsC-like NDP-sugar epimerase